MRRSNTKVGGQRNDGCRRWRYLVESERKHEELACRFDDRVLGLCLTLIPAGEDPCRPPLPSIRRFLNDAFGAEEFRTLCFDYFHDVYDDFTIGMAKTQMIQLLIERCVRREALASLEAALRAERRGQFEQRFGAAPAPLPPAAPVEPVPAGRDPRQVFISHAHQDAAFAHRLAADLRARRVARLDRAGEHPAGREVGRGDRSWA